MVVLTTGSGVPPLLPTPRSIELLGGAFARSDATFSFSLASSAAEAAGLGSKLAAQLNDNACAATVGKGEATGHTHETISITMAIRPHVHAAAERRRRRHHQQGGQGEWGRGEEWVEKDAHGPILVGPEAYELVLTRGQLQISAEHIAGLQHGSTTALQLLRQHRSPLHASVVPALRIADAPVSAYRGIMIDNIRQPHSFAFHMQMVELLAAAKLNVYQLHTSDTGGYSLPSKVCKRCCVLVVCNFFFFFSFFFFPFELVDTYVQFLLTPFLPTIASKGIPCAANGKVRADPPRSKAVGNESNLARG